MYTQEKRKMQECLENLSNLRGRSYKILLIEDHPMLQLINKKLLEMLNCMVDIAVNGQQAIEKFDNGYDLIFLDIGLPDMSGIDVCKILRKADPRHETPIIALTAIGNLVHTECLAAGVDQVATKPVLLEGLDEILKSWIK